MTDVHDVTEGSGDVFVDLGVDPESAGRLKERAHIVMWLRETIAATPSPALSVHAMSLADAIERGDHLKEGA